MIIKSINVTNSQSSFWIKLLVATLCVSVVSGCSGRKDVVTQDDSAEYREARTLPPLKKPSSEVITASTNAQPQAQTASQSSRSTAAESAVTSAPEGSLAVNTPADPSTVPFTEGPISASVVDKKGDSAQLLISADFDRAWVFMRNNLNKSDITVHSRNKAAGRVLIGCSSIDETETTTDPKKGGWSVFRRSSKEDLEHCALQLVSSKGSTLVNVLNRSGASVPAAAANKIFSRLLNN